MIAIIILCSEIVLVVNWKLQVAIILFDCGCTHAHIWRVLTFHSSYVVDVDDTISSFFWGNCNNFLPIWKLHCLRKLNRPTGYDGTHKCLTNLVCYLLFTKDYIVS